MQEQAWNKTEQALRYTLQEEDQPDLLSMEMIQRNEAELQWLLPMQFERKDGKLREFVYDCTAMTSLKEYLKEFAIQKKWFYETANSVLDHLEQCDYYMIPRKEILLRLDTVYFDAATMRTALLCLPICQEASGCDLRQFFLDLLDHIYLDVNAFQESGDFQKLYDGLEKETLDIPEMRKKLKEFMGISSETPETQQPISKMRTMTETPSSQPVQDLIEVAGNAAARSIPQATMQQQATGKKKMPSLNQLFGKKEPAANAAPTGGNNRGGGFMAQLRSAQKSKTGTQPAAAPTAPVQYAAAPQLVRHPDGQLSGVKGGTIMILHDDPDMKAYLICRSGKLQINPEGTNVGRSFGKTAEHIDICLDSVHVSSYHAHLEYDFEKDCYTVTDHSSTGTQQNGSKLSKQVPSELHDGDTLIFGDVSCRVVLEETKGEQA